MEDVADSDVDDSEAEEDHEDTFADEDWSAEPELYILSDAIETSFAELRDKVCVENPEVATQCVQRSQVEEGVLCAQVCRRFWLVMLTWLVVPKSCRTVYST